MCGCQAGLIVFARKIPRKTRNHASFFLHARRAEKRKKSSKILCGCLTSVYILRQHFEPTGVADLKKTSSLLSAGPGTAFLPTEKWGGRILYQSGNRCHQKSTSLR